MYFWCRWAFASVFLALTLFAGRAWADDPRLEYRTITTPNFFVHYYEGIDAIAVKVAIACEEAHQILVPMLEWTPRGRTHVVVNDKVDVANGSATVFGRPTINVFAMAPESDSVLGFYDDWMRVLVFHEYVHILQLDTVLGLPSLVNRVIGQQWIPGNTLPRWYVEGLATYYESLATRGGRVKSSLFKMYLRVAALEDDFFTISEASGPPTDWPGGTVAYLYGGFFLTYVHEKHGADFGAAFNQVYGRRVMPWALNAIANDIAGETFDELWEEWQAAEAGRAVAELVGVTAAGRTDLDWVTKEGGQSGWPRRRPGTNEIWFLQFDHTSAPYYASVLTTGGPVTRRFEAESGAGAFDFTPDGKELIYTQSQTFQSSYRYLDLYAYNVDTKSSRRLTTAERARDPAVSPDGARLAYVRNREGTMELVVRPYPHVSGPERVLVSGLEHGPEEPGRWQQIATPDWSPDGSKLVFSWWSQATGNRDLWLYDFDAPLDAALRQLTDDFAVDLDPHWAPDGLVYFSSDRTGIYNVYALEPQSGRIVQASNVIGGVVSPRVSADGRWLYVGAYGPEGFDLARFRNERRTVASESVRINEFAAVEYPDVDTSAFDDAPYQPARWLKPLLLSPQLGVVTSGAGFGIGVESYDPIGHHAWEVAGGYTTGRELTDKSANIGGSYAYGGLPVAVSVSGLVRDFSRSRSYFVGSDFLPYLERQYLGRLRLSYPFRGLLESVAFSVRYDLDYRKFQNVPPVEFDPADLEPELPQLGWFNELGFSLSYSSREAYPRSVTTAKGWSAAVGFDVMNPAIGSDYENLQLTYGFDLFVTNPVWERHALGLFLDGAITVSDLTSPRRYAIGGNRPQDVFTSIVLQQQRREVVVRGFPANVRTGSQFQVAKLEYRFPIFDFDKGFSTVPVYFRQLKGVAFLDTGGAFDGFLADANYLTGVGGEIILESVFAYYLGGNLRLGYAHGLGAEGTDEFYVLFGGGF